MQVLSGSLVEVEAKSSGPALGRLCKDEGAAVANAAQEGKAVKLYRFVH